MDMIDRQASARLLSRCYIVALTVIALLSIASHVVLAGTVAEVSGSAALIHQSTRQSMLSQRIAGLSTELVLGDESARVPLVHAIADLRATHEKLVNMLTTIREDDRPILTSIYFGGQGVDRRMERFTAEADEVAAHPANASAQTDRNLAIISAEARGPLLTGLERISTIHRSATEAHTSRLVMLQWMILVVVLATLMIEGLFIFRPMMKRMAEYLRALFRIADTDFLTGLANRRAFFERSGRAIANAAKHAHPVSLLLVDVDHFKAVNDSFGHPAGDDVLVAIAAAAEQTRHVDLVGRIGGEEFALLLPGSNLAQANAIAERLRVAIEALRVTVDGGLVSPTVSIGVAIVHATGVDPLGSAMRLADTMLYRAKEAGRNRVWPAIELHAA